MQRCWLHEQQTDAKVPDDQVPDASHGLQEDDLEGEVDSIKPDWAGLLPGALQIVCRQLGPHDVLACRHACHAWRGVAQREVGAACMSLKAQGPAGFQLFMYDLRSKFACVHSVTLCSMAAAAARAGAGSTLSLATMVDSLASLPALRHLTLQDFPVHPDGPPPVWSLSHLRSLPRITTLKLHLHPALPVASLAVMPAPSVAAQHAAQAALLRGLPPLASLRTLSLQLLELHGSDDGDGLPSQHGAPALNGLAVLPWLEILEVDNAELGAASFAVLCGSLTGLRSLSLQGVIGLSYTAMAGVRLLRLQSLSLRGVVPEYDDNNSDDDDGGDSDNTERILTRLYKSLLQATEFRALCIELRRSSEFLCSNTMHEIPPPLRNLLSLQLSCPALGCGTVLPSVAEFTALTSLKLTYSTIVDVALDTDDLDCLTTLSRLRVCHLLEHAEQEGYALCLDDVVLNKLTASMPFIHTFHYRGRISIFGPSTQPASGSAPVEGLLNWPSLTDLNLCHLVDTSGRYAGQAGDGEQAGNEQWLSCSQQPHPALAVDLKRSWPPRLERLTLRNVVIQVTDLQSLGLTHGACLRQLRLYNCGVTAEHMMVADFGFLCLELLHMHVKGSAAEAAAAAALPYRGIPLVAAHDADLSCSSDEDGSFDGQHGAATSAPAAATAAAAAGAAAAAVARFAGAGDAALGLVLESLGRLRGLTDLDICAHMAAFPATGLSHLAALTRLTRLSLQVDAKLWLPTDVACLATLVRLRSLHVAAQSCDADSGADSDGGGAGALTAAVAQALPFAS